MKKRLLILFLTGASLVAVPSAAQAHTSSGSATCVLVSNVPTITSTVTFTDFADRGQRPLNTPEYDVQVDGASHPGQASFAGSSSTVTPSGISTTAGDHTVNIYTQWSSSETRDGNSQGKTKVFHGTVTCPTPVTPPPPPVNPPPVTPPTPPKPPVTCATSPTAPGATQGVYPNCITPQQVCTAKGLTGTYTGGPLGTEGCTTPVPPVVTPIVPPMVTPPVLPPVLPPVTPVVHRKPVHGQVPSWRVAHPTQCQKRTYSVQVKSKGAVKTVNWYVNGKKVFTDRHSPFVYIGKANGNGTVAVSAHVLFANGTKAQKTVNQGVCSEPIVGLG